MLDTKYIFCAVICLLFSGGCAFNPADEAYINGLRAEKGEINANPLDCYNRAIELAPNESGYYSARAKVYSAKKNYQNALKDFNKAISLLPERAYLYYERGYCHCALYNYEVALADFSKAIKMQPKNYQYYPGLAFAYMGMGNFKEAIIAVDKTKAERNYLWRFQKAFILTRMVERKMP